MIIEPRVDKQLEKAENRYELAMTVSRRARQIIEGDEPKVSTKEKSPITIATLEFDKGEVYAEKNNEQA